MLDTYRGLERKERNLVRVAGVVLVALATSVAVGGAGIVAAAQIAAALGTVVLAGLAYAQVREMREVRVAQERPQVILDADYSDRDTVAVVVRNIGPGAAKDVTFEFSAPLESTLRDPKGGPGNFVVSDLPFLKDGLDYLAPGAEIKSGWDTYVSLHGLLEDRGLRDGIRIKSRFRDLAGREYETEWTVDPLKVVGALDFGGLRRKGVHELVNEVKKLTKLLDKVTDSSREEFRISTAVERRKRREDIAAGGQYQGSDKVSVERGEGLVLNGQVLRYLGDGMYQVGVSGQGIQRITEHDLSPRSEDDDPEVA